MREESDYDTERVNKAFRSSCKFKRIKAYDPGGVTSWH